jgi:GDSL-like lipase/acylhydrolase family protein
VLAPSLTRMQRWKRFVFGALGVTLGIAVAFGAATAILAWRSRAREVRRADYPALQVQLDYNPKSLYIFDEDTSYRLKPRYTGFRWETKNSPHITNSRGLLGPAEIDPSRSVRKVIFLGDSVTYGDRVPIESVFVSRIQEMAGAGWQLMNAGTPGWSTHQELKFFDRYMTDVPWRAVVVVFCLNDLVRYEWVWRSDRLLSLSDEMRAVSGLPALQARTAKALELTALRNTFRKQPSTAILADVNTAVLRAWDRDDWVTYERDVLGPWLQKHAALPVMIVIAPTREQLKALAAGAPRDVVLFPQARLTRICTEAAVSCVDPVDAFGRLDPDRLFADDLHFTEAGHAALAGYLWPRLERFVTSRGAE